MSTKINSDKSIMTDEAIRLFHRLAQTRMKHVSEQWRNLDVPLAQLKSLFLIHTRGNINVRTLAAELGVTPCNVTGIIDRLVKQGLVKRSENSEDRRVVWLELTGEGQETITEIQEIGHSYMKGILERMNLDDVGALVKGLSAFIDAIELNQPVKTEKCKNTLMVI